MSCVYIGSEPQITRARSHCETGPLVWCCARKLRIFSTPVWLTFAGLRAGREISTLLVSKMAILGVISSVGLTIFPFILPSSSDPRSSLTVWNSSSSHLTLFIMLVATVIFLPLILVYTAWVYKVLWGKVTEDDVADNSHSVY